MENRNSLNLGKVDTNHVPLPPKHGCMDTLIEALSASENIAHYKKALNEFTNVLNFLTTLAKVNGKDMGIFPILENLLPNDVNKLKKILPALERLSKNPDDMMSLNLEQLVTHKINIIETNAKVDPFPADEVKLINLFMRRYNDPNSYGQYRLYKNIIDQIDGTINAINAYYQGMQASELSASFKNMQDLKNQIATLEKKVQKNNDRHDLKTLQMWKATLTKMESYKSAYLHQAEPLAKIKNMLTIEFKTENIHPLLTLAKQRNANNVPVLHAILQIGGLVMNKNISDMLDLAMVDLSLRFKAIEASQLPPNFTTLQQLQRYIAANKDAPTELRDIATNLVKQQRLIAEKINPLKKIKSFAENNTLSSQEARALLRQVKEDNVDDYSLIKTIESVMTKSEKTTFSAAGLFKPQANPVMDASPAPGMGKKK